MNLPQLVSNRRMMGYSAPVDDYGILPLVALGLAGIVGATGVGAYGVHRLTKPSPSGEGPLQTIAKSGQNTMITLAVIGAVLYFALQRMPKGK